MSEIENEYSEPCGIYDSNNVNLMDVSKIPRANNKDDLVVNASGVRATEKNKELANDSTVICVLPLLANIAKILDNANKGDRSH